MFVVPFDNMGGARRWGWWYTCALFGSQARDMVPVPKNTLIIVHHIVVMFCCVVALQYPMYIGGGFVGGTSMLEFGSIWYNLIQLYPHSKEIMRMYTFVMSLSNVVASTIGLYILL